MPRASSSAPNTDPTPNTDPAAIIDPAPIIELSGIGKTYRFHRTRSGLRGSVRDLFGRQQGERVAVADLDLTIRPGEFVGLLGRNGAGKTTTLKMLSGLLRPSTGRARVLGYEPYRRGFDYLRQVAIVLGNKTMLWWDVSTRSNLELYEALYDLEHADFERSVAELAEMLGVTDHLDIPVRKLSLGERMKCELMLALVHRPRVLFLDEPTIGLDVVSKAAIRQFLAATCAERGTTIILTSHDMDDVEELCQRVVLIDHGRLQFDGTPEELVRSTRPRKRVQCTFADLTTTPSELPAGVQLTGADLASGQLRFETERESVGVLLAVAPQWGSLIDLEVRDAELDEVMQSVLASTNGDTSITRGAR